MIVAKLLPIILVFGLLAGILTSPIWGRWLRSYRQITQKAAELRSLPLQCVNAPCFLGGVGTTLEQLASKDKLGAKLSLVHCVNVRMNECFSEWARDTVRRLFPRVVCSLIVFLVGFALVGSLAPQLTLFDNLRDIDTILIAQVAIGLVFSATEIYTAIQMSGRYSEIATTGQKLLAQIG